ncbi:hypothetical protein [Haladaptatus caseinilyticus]|uniref:hypothetical protein n=1 Tax=Haladaptatus caseinilyticus TaxID=2993314 RepID=UPI00224B85F5|nr:hypothetical protein [Haladaptatus caseinilyticus]
MSNTDLKQAVLDSDPNQWVTDGVPDSFTHPDRDISVKRIGEWSNVSAPWDDWSDDDSLQQATYRLFHDDSPFDQVSFLALDDGTLLPMPEYGPPTEDPGVLPDEFVFSLNRYEEALGKIASTNNFDAKREEVGVQVRDEPFRR